jgi:hypothetical protein
MATTPLWVPLAVAALAVLGTLAGVVFTQVWNSRLEERRWAREVERLREAQAREDVNRAYEHRRAAYADFVQEFMRLQKMFGGSSQQAAGITDPAFAELADRLAAVNIYGTYEAVELAGECFGLLNEWACRRDKTDLAGPVVQAVKKFFAQIRKDLGVPERKPAEDRIS